MVIGVTGSAEVEFSARTGVVCRLYNKAILNEAVTMSLRLEGLQEKYVLFFFAYPF